MADDTAARLTALKEKVQEADRLRASAEANVDFARKRLAEIDAQIEAQGIKPKDLDKEIVKLEAKLAQELTTIDQQLTDEINAYRQILLTVS